MRGIEDLIGGLGPDEGPGIVIPFVDPDPDVALEVDHAAVGAAAHDDKPSTKAPDVVTHTPPATKRRAVFRRSDVDQR